AHSHRTNPRTSIAPLHEAPIAQPHPIRAATGSKILHALYIRFPTFALRRSRSCSASCCVACVETGFNSLFVSGSTTTHVSSGKLFVGMEHLTIQKCLYSLLPPYRAVRVRSCGFPRRCGQLPVLQCRCRHATPL